MGNEALKELHSEIADILGHAIGSESVADALAADIIGAIRAHYTLERAEKTPGLIPENEALKELHSETSAILRHAKCIRSPKIADEIADDVIAEIRAHYTLEFAKKTQGHG